MDGNLLDKDYEILTPSETPEEAVSSLVKQYYLTRCGAPKQIFLPCEMEDAELFAELLQQNLGKKVRISRPQRGDNVKLVELANKNAREEAERITNKQERQHGALRLLEGMLGRSEPLHRLESYDISHIAGTDIVPQWWMFCDGAPSKKDYKRFKLEDMPDQDDYASMRQVLTRRLRHFAVGDARIFGKARRPADRRRCGACKDRGGGRARVCTGYPGLRHG